MKAEIGIDEHGEFYLRIQSDTEGEASMLAHVTPVLGLSETSDLWARDAGHADLCMRVDGTSVILRKRNMP